MPLLGGFGKKEHASPVDKVISMKQQGASNDEIIQTLQRDGFKTDKIFDAISQADIKRTISPTIPQPVQPLQNPMQFPTAVEPNSEKIEEVAEAIIDEKWNVLVDQFNKIIDWKEGIDKELISLNERINTIKSSVQDIQNAMMGKLDKYDENVAEVGTDIKALTKVFQKMLPGFVENVSELSRITDKLGGKTSKKKVVEEHKSKSEEIFGESEEEASIEDLT